MLERADRAWHAVTAPCGSARSSQRLWRALLALGVLAGCWWPCAPGATARATSPAVTVWAWGLNRYGQLGDGATTDSTTPVMVGGAGDITALAAGCLHSLALASDGTVWAWGFNGSGQLGTGTASQSTVPVAVPDLAGVVAIAAGCLHSLAVRADGTVWAWGRNGGRLGTGTSQDSGVPVQVHGLGGAVAVAAGIDHSLALLADGTVWAWGDNTYGQLGMAHACDPLTGAYCSSLTPVQVRGLTGVVAIAAGGDHNLALTAHGTVYAWGANENGQVGTGVLGDQPAPALVSGISGVRAIAAGSYHGLALTSAGAVYAWGLNTAGQLGASPVAASSTPVPVAGLSEITALAAGDQHSLALRADGTVWAWGSNTSGQLGVGQACDPTSRAGCASAGPAQVPAVAGIRAIAAGGNHSLALVGALATVTPSTLTFGAQMVGTGSLTRTLTISSTGGASLIVSTAVLSGTAAGDFTLPASSCAIVPPGSACTITVGFTPHGAGERSALLLLTNNTPTSPLSVTLSGSGMAPPTPTPVPTPTMPARRRRSRPSPCPARPSVLPVRVSVPHTAVSGRPLRVQVSTTRGASVTVALRVVSTRVIQEGRGARRRRVRKTVLLYAATRRGTADARGRLVVSPPVMYQARQAIEGWLSVTARAGCRTHTLRVGVWLRPRGHR